MNKSNKVSDNRGMKNTRTPTFMAFLALSLLLLLPGYKGQIDNDFFPAPVANPVIACYANFAPSGLYDHGQNSVAAIHEIIGAIENICLVRGSGPDEVAKIRTSAESLVNDRIIDGHFKVYEAYFYFRDGQNFALILNGDFALDKIAALIGEPRINMGSGKITSTIKSITTGKNRLHLEIKPDQMTICPENIAGNIMDSINNKTSLLGNEFNAFAKMVKTRPALAAELAFDEFTREAGAGMVPDWLTPLKHLRMLAAGRMTKMQMFVPENDSRQMLAKTLSESMPAINSATGDIASLSLTIKGNSIFVEAPPETNLERSISSRTAAFILHFFVRAQKSSPVLTASVND